MTTSPTALREAMARAHLDLIREGYGGQPAPDSVWAIMLHRYAQGYEDPEGAFKATDAILRAIDAAGWQVVPRKMTDEMGGAGVRTMLGDSKPGPSTLSFAEGT